MVIRISKIPQGLEVFLLCQLQPLNFQWVLKLTDLMSQFSSKISYYKQNINSLGHVEFSETYSWRIQDLWRSHLYGSDQVELQLWAVIVMQHKNSLEVAGNSLFAS